MPYLLFHKKRIFYKDSGQGSTLVMLHGYTESGRIWDRFSKSLSKDFRVIVPDLPGHGKSECISEVHSMELQAEVINALLNKEGIKKCILVGHSMGGYVTQAFAVKYPQKLRGFGLVHSHCFPDSPEDGETRRRAIEVIRNDKFGYLSKFIPGLFPEEVRLKFDREISELVRVAQKMPKEGVIAAQEGMRIRRDQSSLLRSTKLPVLFILGLRDSKIPVARFWEMITLPSWSEALVLKNTGHMGFIESPKQTLSAIRHFALKIEDQH